MSKHTYKKKKVKINYVRFILSMLIILGIIAGIVFLVQKCADKKDNDDKNSSSSNLSSSQIVSSDPEPKPEPTYEERVGKEYAIDIEPYLEYIEPEDKYEYVFLVNPTHTLASDYVPEDLTDCGHTRKDGRATQKMRLAAAKALQAFLAEGKKTGKVTNVTVTSAYRSYSYQNQLFTQYFNRDWATGKYATKAECEAHVLTYSTKPGTSEHQSGLCCDMHNIPSAEQYFAQKPEAKWLAENCYRFGFILRYPEDKQDITKIIYEPWHFRFVGRDAATEMHEKGMCLEEYIEYKGLDN